MKKLIIPLVFAVSIPLSFSCGPGKFGYRLTEQDAIMAIRELLQIGTRQGMAGVFNREMIMSAVFPKEINRVLDVLSLVGLTSEVDRFTTTMATAAEKSATRSIPIFLDAITKMSFTDAIKIVKSGGTSATDYLRATVGGDLRRSLTPVMQAALDEYKLNEQWSKVMKPVQVAGITLNPDLSAIMALLVSDAMFRKIGEKEREIRTNQAARTTTLLERVFGRNWN